MPNNKRKNVGLIMKDNALSVIEMEIRNNIPVITNYATTVLEEGVVANGCIILNKQSFQEVVKKLLKSGVGGPFKVSEILISLPEEQVFSHQLEIPKDKINDADFIKNAARDYIPIELDDAVFDCKILHEEEDKKTLILNFAALQKNVANPIIEALNEIGIAVISMNIDISCLIKCFKNDIIGAKGDFLLADLSLKRDILAISVEKDGISKIICKGEREEKLEKIRALMNLPTKEEVKQFLIEARQGKEMNEEKKAEISKALAPYFENLSQKIKQLTYIAGSQGPIEIKTIYLSGILSGLPGISEMLGKELPKIPIQRGIPYMEIPAEIEEDALQGIGLCLNQITLPDKSCFNLLPQKKKEEIEFAKIKTRLKIIAVITTLFLTGLGIHTGLKTAGNYLKYRITSQEVLIYNDQAMNPYMTQAVRLRQQTLQYNQQIQSLLTQSIPVSVLIRGLDEHNKVGMTMVNISYTDRSSTQPPSISIRARAADRNETENFVNNLQETPFYLAVDSPLSNLVGKGERFISVSLTVDKEKVKEGTETDKAEPELEAAPTPAPAPTLTPGPKGPSLPKNSEPLTDQEDND